MTSLPEVSPAMDSMALEPLGEIGALGNGIDANVVNLEDDEEFDEKEIDEMYLAAAAISVHAQAEQQSDPVDSHQSSDPVYSQLGW